MSGEIPMFSLIKRGNDSFPRFVIAKVDAYRNAVYWDATSRLWHADETKATVFADVTQACWEQHDLLMEAVCNRPVHRYVAPMYIELYGEKPKLADLRRWLERAMRIVVDSPKHGLGPKGTVGFIIADVEKTRSV